MNNLKTNSKLLETSSDFARFWQLRLDNLDTLLSGESKQEKQANGERGLQ